MNRLIIALMFLAAPVWAADYIAVHNGPQGSGDGSSVANGMSLQGAVSACTSAGDRVLMANTGTYSVGTAITFATAGAGTAASPKWVVGANSSGVIDGTSAAATGSASLFYGGTIQYWAFRYIDYTATGTFSYFLRAADNCIVQDVGYLYSDGTNSYTAYTDVSTSVIERFRFVNAAGSNTNSNNRMFYSSNNIANVVVDSYAYGAYNGFGNAYDNATYIRCVAEACSYGVLSAYAGTGVAVVDSLIYDCTVGVQTNGAVSIVGTTIADCGTGVYMPTGTLVTLVQSIVAYCTGYGLEFQTATLPALTGESYNIFYSNSSGDVSNGSISSTSSNTDPLFTNRASDDYSVTTSSPALQIAVPFTELGATSYTDAAALVPQISGAVYVSDPGDLNPTALDEDTASQVAYVLLVDSGDNTTPETGVSSPTVTISKAGGSFAAPSDGTWTEIGNGLYSIGLDATDTDTAGILITKVVATGCADDYELIQVGSSIAPSAAAIRAEIDSNSTQLAAIVEDTGTTIPATLTTIDGVVDGIAADYSTLTEDSNIGIDLDDTTGALAAGTEITGLADDADIGEALLELVLASYTTAGSVGAAWNDILADTDEVQAALEDGGFTDLLIDAILEDTGTTIPAVLAIIQDIVGDIAAVGRATNEVADGIDVTSGSQTLTYVATQEQDGTYHQVAESGNAIDYYYTFDVGTYGVPTAIHAYGRLDEGSVPSGGDEVDIYAYDWLNAEWDHISPPSGDIIGVANSTSADDGDYVMTLLGRHVGTGANDGIVWIRFEGAALESGTELFLDQVYIEYATVVTADDVWTVASRTLTDPDSYKATGFSTHSAADVWTAGSRSLSTPNDYKADVSGLSTFDSTTDSVEVGSLTQAALAQFATDDTGETAAGSGSVASLSGAGAPTVEEITEGVLGAALAEQYVDGDGSVAEGIADGASGGDASALAAALFDTPVTDLDTAGSAGELLVNIGAATSGTGGIAVDHDYDADGSGDADQLAWQTAGGAGVDGATVTAYLASEYATAREQAAARGNTTTNSYGRWNSSIHLAAGSYVLVYKKTGYTTHTVTVTVSE